MDVSTDNRSLTLRSCYESITELPNHKKESKHLNGALVIAQDLQDLRAIEIKNKSLIDFDPITGWR